MKKEVKKQQAGKNFYLYVFLQIQQGICPSKICKQLSISKQRLNYYLSTLKKEGFIKKIGYGVWKIIKKYDPKEVKRYLTSGSKQQEKDFYLLKPDMVRGHAFQFILRIPKLPHWSNRETIFKKKGIKFKQLKNLYGGGQGIEFRGRKIHLTSKSIIIYEKSSYIADTSTRAKSLAIYKLLILIRGLERFLGANFSFKGQYKFKVSRQHYALVKNAIAKQYDKEGKKLKIYKADELWFLIDNSFNLHEAETVHPKTADIDNLPIQNFLNDINANPTTFSEIRSEYYQSMTQLQKNINLHLQVVKEIKQVNIELKKLIKKLGEKNV